MRVVHFSGYVDPEGREPEALLRSWSTLVEVAAAASSAGARVDVVQAARNDAVIVRDGVRVHFVREPRYPALRRLLGHRAAPHPWRSLRYAAGLDADLFHLHGLSFPLQARSLVLTRLPVVVQDHADRVPDRLRRPLHRWGLRGVAGASFTAREMAVPFVERGVLGPDVPIFEALEASTRMEPTDGAGVRVPAGGDPTIVWVGHLAPHKDPLTALEAFEGVRVRFPEACLWMLFPSDPIRGEIDAWLDRRPATAAGVRLIGAAPHAEMPAYLTAADLLLSTSLSEGSGYAVLEALACGAPVVLSDIPAHRALAKGLRMAATVRPGDPSAFAKAIVDMVELVRGSEARGVLEEVRGHFDAHLSYATVGRALVAMYESVLDGRSGVAAA